MYIRLGLFLLLQIFGKHNGVELGDGEPRQIGILNQVDTPAHQLETLPAPSHPIPDLREPVGFTQISSQENPEFEANGMIRIVIDDGSHREHTTATEESPSNTNGCAKPNVGSVSEQRSPSGELSLSLDGISRVASMRSEECAIYLEAIGIEDEHSLYSECHHPFHKSCVDQWSIENNTCPICRTIDKNRQSTPVSNHLAQNRAVMESGRQFVVHTNRATLPSWREMGQNFIAPLLGSCLLVVIVAAILTPLILFLYAMAQLANR